MKLWIILLRYETIIDQLKEAYLKAERYLSVSKVTGRPDAEDAKREMLLTMFKEQAKMFGLDITTLLKDTMTKEQMIDRLRDALQKRTRGECSDGVHCERYDVKTVDVTDMDAIVALVAQGYEKQFDVNGKVILRKQI